MTQIATVEKILPGGMAEISVPRKSACGHDCEECAGCGVSGASVRAVARNDARAEVGQKVVVESSTKNLLGVMLLVYLLPIVLFLVGYFATGALESEGLRYAAAIAPFLVGIIPAIICDRRTKKNGKLTFTTVRLFYGMFGYMRPSKLHLSEQDEARFQSVYCGLCHELGRKYGFAARFVLNFDFTFLAILLSDAQEPECESCRCAAHPCKAQCVMAHTVALETAADHSLVLAWWQLRDHIDDHGFFKAIPYRLAALLLRRAYRKARTFVPEFDASVQRHLNDLHEREREHCASLDQAAEPFAALMADIADCVDDEMRRRVMKEIFYHLGRWIYLVDAADDFEKDAHSNCYNPLRYRYELDGDKLDEQSREAVAASLDLSVHRMASAYALLSCGVWTSILDSIFYESLYGIGNAVLKGTYHKPPRRIHFRIKAEKNEETV